MPRRSDEPEEAEQPEPGRIGEYPEGRRKTLGIIGSERFGEQLRAALGVDHLDELHRDILTTVDVPVNVSRFIDAMEERRCPDERAVLPVRLLPV